MPLLEVRTQLISYSVPFAHFLCISILPLLFSPHSLVQQLLAASLLYVFAQFCLTLDHEVLISFAFFFFSITCISLNDSVGLKMSIGHLLNHFRLICDAVMRQCLLQQLRLSLYNIVRVELIFYF